MTNAKTLFSINLLLIFFSIKKSYIKKIEKRKNDSRVAGNEIVEVN